MANAKLLNKKAEELAHEAREYLAGEASDWIDDGVAAVESGLEDVADHFKENVEETLTPRRRIPWMSILAGAALVAGVVYLARHRAQRQLLRKGVVKGVQGGAVLALMVPGGLRKARESADQVVKESARFLERLGDKIPVRVVMK
jgi:hypothetical protein